MTVEKKKICVVFCGGTIAMAKNQETGALQPARSPDELLAYVPKAREFADVDLVEVFNKDSSNLTPTDWTKIVEAVQKVYGDYDGIVVTHGTDTMANSAAAVSFGLRNVNKPIVFTGSQATLDVMGSDAPFNLENAFRVATSEIAQVVISFGHYIHSGVRAVKKSESAYDAFESPINGPIGFIQSELKWTANIKRKSPGKNSPLIFQPKFTSGILSIQSSPPMEPWMIANLVRTGKVKGIIFEALGAGNIAEHYHEVIREVTREYRVPVLVTSPFIGGTTAGMGTYAAGLGALEAGAISTGDMTVPAASVKLSWLLAQIEEKIKSGVLSKEEIIQTVKQAFETNYVGEITI